MEFVKFQPLPGSSAQVEGYLHLPSGDAQNRREAFPAVVVCPGGGYESISAHEADPVALDFLAHGCQAFVLTYSIGEEAKDFRPLKELSETVRRIRENAAQWRVDPEKIAVCGFSAGGHLAASLGTLWNDPELLQVYDSHGGQNRPNAMILCYPVITSRRFPGDDIYVESLSRVSGCQPGEPGYEYFSLEKHISQDTCPAFLWHTAEDDIVDVENTLAMVSALHQAGVPCEAHIFPFGGHGLSVCTQEIGMPHPHNAQWMDLCLRWLEATFGYTL